MLNKVLKRVFFIAAMLFTYGTTIGFFTNKWGNLDHTYKDGSRIMEDVKKKNAKFKIEQLGPGVEISDASRVGEDFSPKDAEWMHPLYEPQIKKNFKHGLQYRTPMENFRLLRRYKRFLNERARHASYNYSA